MATPDGAVLVSVIIPAFDAEQTIDDQLEALSRQRFDGSWEVLVCDNGSTDGTARAAERWQGRIPSVRVVDAAARRGPSAARNAGAAVSSAEYLLFCDADDVVADEWISTFVDALRRTPYAVGVVDWDRLRRPRAVTNGAAGQSPDLVSASALPGILGAGSNNFAIRRDLYLAHGGFEESLRSSEDVDLVYRLQFAGAPLTVCSALCYKRPRDGVVAVARQAYAWGAGRVALADRWSEVRDALDGAAPTTGRNPTDSSTEGTTGIPLLFARLRRRISSGRARIARGQWRIVVGDAVFRYAYALGGRAGRRISGLERISPSPEGLDNLTRARERPWSRMNPRR